MIKILKESLKNLPSWLKPYLNKYMLSTLNKEGIDLYNVNYEDASDIRARDPRWTASDNLLVALVDTGFKDALYLWSSNHGALADPYCQDGKNASKHSRQWLIDHATKIGFLKKNQKPYKNRYQDPRKSYNRSDGRHGKYAGQTYYDYTTRYKYDPATMPPGEWYSGSGRDKSGYVIPDPAKLVGKLYEFDLDNAAKVLDNYYKKITRIKKQVFDIDFRGLQSKGIDPWGEDYSNLVRSFGYVAKYFVDLEKEINRILQDSKSKDWDTYFDKYPGMTKDEWFKQRLEWASGKKNLDDELYDIQSKLKKINS